MKIASWADRHARSILFMLIALVAGGVLASFAVPVSLFPHVNFPRLRVSIDAGEQPAERMMTQVTRPVEETLRAIPGVRGVRSTTSRGSAEVWLTFDWGQDMGAALLQAQSQVNQSLASLPAGTSFDVRRMDPTVFPVISYSLTSNGRPMSEVRDLAQYQLRPILTTVPGVARIDVQGGAIAELRVIVDPAKLAANGLTIDDVATSLSATNVVSALGQIEDHRKLYLVVADTKFKDPSDIGKTIIRATPTGAGIVRLADVATIATLPAPQFTHAVADGRDAVLVNVYQQPDGNTVAIARGIRAALVGEQKRLPADITIKSWYDQSDLITESAAGVRDAVIIGVVLAALVLLLFLRNWRMTLIAALAVPVVLSITALVLYLLGESFNIMTLGGMAAAVGLIIDDAIVMSEHIVRRLRSGDGSTADSRGRVLRAADEFSKPLAGSSLSTIVIHIPPAFLIGVTGAFFGALSLAMASSLVISFLVAWLVIPTIAAKLLRGHTPKEYAEKTKPSAYERIMRGVLAWPLLIALPMVPLLAGGYLAYARLPSGFMPTTDEGGFIIDYVGPPGASLVETDRLLHGIEAILAKTPEVLTYSRRTGFGLGGDINEPSAGDFFVRLKPGPRRAIDDVMKDVRVAIARDVPGMDVELAQLMEDLIGDLTGRPEPIVVNLFASNESTLEPLAAKVADAVGKVKDVAEVRSGIVPAGDSLSVKVDRAKAALEGVDPDAVAKRVGDLLSGKVATQIQQGEKLVNVRVWIPASARRTRLDLEALRLRAPDGHLFPVSRVAELETITGEPEINREDLERVVSVTGRSDRDLGSTIRDIKAVLDAPGFLPADARYTLGGLYEQQQVAFRGLVQVMIAGAALVFLLLLYLYESFRVAIAILTTTLLAIAAVFIGLWWTNTELNIASLMGMVMIVGNVTEVAIFYYSEFAALPSAMPARDRLILAGSRRTRAIAMTTAAAILALLPLAIGLGQGSGTLQPLAIAIIAGLAAQLPLVLVALPAVLYVLGATRADATANH